MTKGFTSNIIIVNIIMGLLLVLSSELVLIFLTGKIVQGANIFIDFGFVDPSGYPPPTVHAPLPNLPFFVFLLSLIVNIYFLIKLRRNKNQSDT